MMRFSGYQPQYFPRLHYFARALDSDVFGVSDYLQHVRKHAFPQPDGSSKRGFSHQAHTPIKLHQGKTYLSIPTKRKSLAPINQTEIDYNQRWARKHIRSIQSGYSRARYFKEIFPEIVTLLEKQYESLAQLSITTFLWAMARILGEQKVNPYQLSFAHINHLLKRSHPFRLRQIILMSNTDIPPPDEKFDANDWLIEICRRFNAEEYFFGGTAAASYMDFEKFRKAKITLIEQNWKCPKYWQQFPNLGFIPNLAIIDLLMNESLNNQQRVFLGE